MTITAVRTVSVKGSKTWNYVRLESASGVVGTGEAHPGAGIPELVEQRLKPLLVGENALNVEPLQNRLLTSTTGDSSGGMLVGAIGGVATALWDLKGKALGVPVFQLLGGAYRDRILLYADVGRGVDMANTPESWAARAREVAAEGFDAIKFDIDHAADEASHDVTARGLSLVELSRLTSLVEAARGALGDAVDVAIDCHGSYHVRDVILLAQRLERFALMFLEDPVPAENVDALAKVTGSTPIPICTGEWLYRRDGFRRLIERQACASRRRFVPAGSGQQDPATRRSQRGLQQRRRAAPHRHRHFQRPQRGAYRIRSRMTDSQLQQATTGRRRQRRRPRRAPVDQKRHRSRERQLRVLTQVPAQRGAVQAAAAARLDRSRVVPAFQRPAAPPFQPPGRALPVRIRRAARGVHGKRHQAPLGEMIQSERTRPGGSRL